MRYSVRLTPKQAKRNILISISLTILGTVFLTIPYFFGTVDNIRNRDLVIPLGLISYGLIVLFAFAWTPSRAYYNEFRLLSLKISGDERDHIKPVKEELCRVIMEELTDYHIANIHYLIDQIDDEMGLTFDNNPSDFIQE